MHTSLDGAIFIHKWRENFTKSAQQTKVVSAGYNGHCKWEEHNAGFHLEGLNLSITNTEMVHLLPYSYLLSGSKVHDL